MALLDGETAHVTTLPFDDTKPSTNVANCPRGQPESPGHAETLILYSRYFLQSGRTGAAPDGPAAH